MKKLALATTYVIIIVSAFFIVYLFLSNNNKPNNTHSNNSVEPAIPSQSNDFVLKDLAESNNVTVNFSDKPTVILFFTSWCPYCNEDAPKLVKLEKQYKSEVNVFGINVTYRDNIQDVKEYVQQHYIEYPTLLDESGDIYNKFGGSGFPSLYFFNAQGDIVDAIIGSTDIETIENSFKYLLENFNV
ncbi:TlpA family protein disulfide reductase [Cohnella boryungensis]|uniref:TlpA family protein disulfide reductase n=1 Tax=Cohnella boryungensis TaxID=768479 RepID=A0ABV8SI90_9BACL